MISFQEYISLREENLEKDEYETQGEFLERILFNLEHEDMVKFAYNAANMARSLMPLQARKVLDLVKIWLDSKSINIEELRNASNDLIRHDDDGNAAAINAAKVITTSSSRHAPADHAVRTAVYAARAYSQNRSSDFNKIFNKFIQLAKSLVADKKHDPAPSNQWFDKSDKDYETIAVWLDSLEEDGHLEILNQIKSLVQNTEGVQARANQDLAKLIVNSPHKDQYLHYIQNVFKGK